MITATEIYCLNELGKRSNNEDAIAPQKGQATLRDKVFVVCDGVGGESKGEVASAIVASSILQYLQKPIEGKQTEREAIQKSIYHANQQLSSYATTDSSAKRMSTTLALVYLSENAVHVAWCGDTRVHHIRNGRVLWKSQDHSLVGDLVSQGELTEEEARSHPKRNIITRSLNALNYNNTVDFHMVTDIADGDYFLLCTDGFLERVNNAVIQEVLTSEDPDKTKQFFTFCEGQTRDNFSMYLLRVENIAKLETVKTKPTLFWAILFLLGCLMLLFFLYTRT